MDPDARLPLRLSQHAMALGRPERLRDPHLGLKLGQMLCFRNGREPSTTRRAPLRRSEIPSASRCDTAD